MKALEILVELNNTLTNYDHTLETRLTEAIVEIQELQEELKIANEAYALLLKQYHELKGE